MNIFAHFAPGCLTDHEPNGEGLIGYSLLNGLAERGHQVFVYTSDDSIQQKSERLHVKASHHRIPANSLATWEHLWRAEQWLQELGQTRSIDLVWRMYGGGCPRPPRISGRPLVVGPLSYSWPQSKETASNLGRPRMGVGIGGIMTPFARRGFQQTLHQASLLLYDTAKHADKMRRRFPQACVTDLPLIVNPPQYGESPSRRTPRMGKPVRLAFVANLSANKRPLIFCEIISLLREAGIQAEGILIGEGPERPAVEAYCAAQSLKSAICLKGKVPNSEVYGYLQKSDFLVSTSLGEPYGRSIAEAMAVGTPCVCHQSGGPADYITNEEDGLLIPELRAKNYADMITHVCQNSSLWEHLSKSALCKASDWTSESILSRLEQHLIQVCKSRRNV